MTILIGVIITMLVLALISYVGALAPLRVATGAILVVAVLVVLTASLYPRDQGIISPNNYHLRILQAIYV